MSTALLDSGPVFAGDGRFVELGPSFFTARVTCSTLLSGKECLQVSAGALHDNNGNVTEDWQR